MLAYILALAVGFGSLSLYLSAFLFPEIYRKYDLLWSGLGLFYALVLWICAGRVTGSLLLGQMANIVLLGGLGWQTLNLRFAQTPLEERIQLQGDSLQEALQSKFTQFQIALEDGSWRTYVDPVLERLPAQVASLARTLQGWIEALISTTLISTTLKPQEFSVEQNPPSEVSDAVEESNLEGRDRPISSIPQPEPVDSSASTEFAAEWDDLGPEVYPELETTDGSGWDFQANPLQGQEADPQTRPKSSEEHSDSR